MVFLYSFVQFFVRVLWLAKCRFAKGGLLASERPSFTLQYATFCSLKEYLLQCRLGCFVIQKHNFRVMLTAIGHCGYAETMLPLNDFRHNLRYVLIS